MGAPERAHALDHVVVLMFENRSFDNLLGRLYEPGEVASFEGVIGKELSNPIPEWAEHGADRSVVPYGVAKNMNTPDPDPGEEYQHVNTQLFGIIDPPSNRGVLAEQMTAPFNAPADPDQVPTMDGFVADYISAFTAEMGRQPTYDEYAQIMTGYTPEQMPVLSTLARGFAMFDHWFCEVPSQTFTNRSFFHAATASGLSSTHRTRLPGAQHGGDDLRPPRRARPDLAGLLRPARALLVHRADPRRPAAGQIRHALLHDRPVLRGRRRTANCRPTPSSSRRSSATATTTCTPRQHADTRAQLDPPSSLLGGEALLAKIYDAVRTSSSPAGSNFLNTLLMVIFDEHGGTYDHVPPPAATRPTRPHRPGKTDFTFDRLGIRVPAIAISPWIPEQTVVNDTYRHTSLIRTLRERWSLGAPLTARDADAPDIAPVLTLDQPRAPEDWPDLSPQPVPDFDETLIPLDQPLSPLAQAFVAGCLALAKELGQPVPDIKDPAALTGAEGLELVHEAIGHLWPAINHATTA